MLCRPDRPRGDGAGGTYGSVGGAYVVVGGPYGSAGGGPPYGSAGGGPYEAGGGAGRGCVGYELATGYPPLPAGWNAVPSSCQSGSSRSGPRRHNSVPIAA